jgi:Zn finger protein HypA/HybF involved in hydrogenase expression
MQLQRKSGQHIMIELFRSCFGLVCETTDAFSSQVEISCIAAAFTCHWYAQQVLHARHTHACVIKLSSITPRAAFNATVGESQH